MLRWDQFFLIIDKKWNIRVIRLICSVSGLWFYFHYINCQISASDQAFILFYI